MTKKVTIISILGGIIIGASLGFLIACFSDEHPKFYTSVLPGGIAGILVSLGGVFTNTKTKKKTLLIKCIVMFFTVVVGLVVWFFLFWGIAALFDNISYEIYKKKHYW